MKFLTLSRPVKKSIVRGAVPPNSLRRHGEVLTLKYNFYLLWTSRIRFPIGGGGRGYLLISSFKQDVIPT